MELADRVLKKEPLTKVPNSHSSLIGIFQLEDKVVPVIDLFSLFKVDTSIKEKENKICKDKTTAYTCT